MAKFLMSKDRLLELIRDENQPDDFLLSDLNGIFRIVSLINVIPKSLKGGIVDILESFPDMSVDKFLERRHAERD
jgi:hypothetical protein